MAKIVEQQEHSLVFTTSLSFFQDVVNLNCHLQHSCKETK